MAAVAAAQRESAKIMAALPPVPEADERPDAPEGPAVAFADPLSDCPSPGQPEALPEAEFSDRGEAAEWVGSF